MVLRESGAVAARWLAVVVGAAVLVVAAWLLSSGEEAAVPPAPEPPLEIPGVPPSPLPPDPGETVKAPSPPELLVRVLAKESGSPVVGAGVLVIDGSESAREWRTDEAGEVLAPSLEPGPTYILVRGPGRVRAEARVTLVAGKAETVEVRLERGAPLQGTVLDDRTGLALPGARVIVVPGGSKGGAILMTMEAPFRETETDSHGRFTLDGIEPGRMVTVRASAAGYGGVAKTVILEQDAEEAREVELRLPPGGALRGVVRFPDGRPVPGAKVYVIPAGAPELLLANPTARSTSGGRTWSALGGEAGEDGAFEVLDLDLGAVYSVLAIFDVHGRSAVVEGISATEQNPRPHVDLVLMESATLTVRVWSPDGKPQETGQILLLGDGFPISLEPRAPGVYVARGPAPGKYKLRVTCPDTVTQEMDLTIAASEEAEIEVRLEHGLVLAGVLVDDLGEPVAGQKIWCARKSLVRGNGGEAMSS